MRVIGIAVLALLAVLVAIIVVNSCSEAERGPDEPENTAVQETTADPNPVFEETNQETVEKTLPQTGGEWKAH